MASEPGGPRRVRSAPPTGKFVSYLRRTRTGQTSSDFPLDLQRACILRHLIGDEWSSIREYIEVEYGRRWRSRPRLAKAIELCREHDAAILIVDEGSPTFLSLSAHLRQRGVRFVAVQGLDREAGPSTRPRSASGSA